ncbi:MAG: bifunctional phosphoribosylaminoimidazolecarboxamide formyltransferase/IMP cyclohydrolase [Ktedonobacteraceae bacterium]|nr:bifunctional phosphoribosylaminoimidazolecarboxamide formyltransferase/IMP cyclohydrolase [Ktedonobacteraceae bacterium]
MRAIMHVVNREGLAELAQELQSQQVTIYAADETLKVLSSEKIRAAPLSELTKFPEILDGGAGVLHPAIVGAILARRGDKRHEANLKAHGIAPIDIVVANLSSSAERTASPAATLDEVLACVDVGALSLIQAAASNFQDVLVLVRPQDYAPVMQEWREQGEVSMETRRRLAIAALQHIASYDSALIEYLRMSGGELFPDELTLSLKRKQILRYGENPHQRAALYRWGGMTASTPLPTVAGADLLHGRDLSFNNLLDLDVALATVQSFTAPTIVIVKHTNPCGLACDDVLVEAYRKAHAGDPISASGGIIGSNRPIDEATAHEICQLFYEAVIAPEFTPQALSLLRQKEALRLLATHRPIEPRMLNTQLLLSARPEVRSISGGLLLQTPDIVGEREAEYSVVTEREPTLDEVTDLMFAWKVVRRVKSNAIVLARKLTLLGVGAGQMSRATSVQLALEKAGTRARGSVMASDASFPFPDGIEAAARAGITAIIQPGGSPRDEEAIRVANRHALAMIFTGRRHFRH